MILKTNDDKKIVIGVDMIPALIGSDMAKRYEYFASSSDKEYNRDFCVKFYPMPIFKMVKAKHISIPITLLIATFQAGNRLMKFSAKFFA